MSGWLADVPNDLSDMRRIARGLVIHYRAERPLEQGIAPQRLAEVDTRYADEMLARLAELDNRTLTGDGSVGSNVGFFADRNRASV
jgi:hypothetical protein